MESQEVSERGTVPRRVASGDIQPIPIPRLIVVGVTRVIEGKAAMAQSEAVARVICTGVTAARNTTPWTTAATWWSSARTAPSAVSSARR